MSALISESHPISLTVSVPETWCFPILKPLPASSGSFNQPDLLPDELLLHIFSYLDAKTIVHSLSVVCRRWNLLCNDGELWYGLCVRRWRTTFEGRNFASLTRKVGRATFSLNAGSSGVNFFKRAYQKEMQFRVLCSPRSGSEYCTDDPTPLFQREKKMWRSPETGWTGFFAIHRATRRHVVIYETEVADQMEREELVSYIKSMREIHERLLDTPFIRAYYNTWIWDPSSVGLHSRQRRASRTMRGLSRTQTCYRVWMVMEFLDLGSFAQLMKVCDAKLGEEQIRVVVHTVLQALVSIRSLAVDHRRIDACVKASNILVNSKGDIKLSDVHGREKPNTHGVHLSLGGSPLWHAPEVIEQGSLCVPEKSWVWSLGITIIELAEGRPPHARLHPLRVLFLISNSPSPALRPVAPEAPAWSELLHDFLAQCLIRDQSERPCAQKLLQHPWITQSPTSVQSLRPLLQKFVDKLEESNEMVLFNDYAEDCLSPTLPSETADLRSLSALSLDDTTQLDSSSTSDGSSSTSDAHSDSDSSANLSSESEGSGDENSDENSEIDDEENDEDQD